MCNSLAVRLYHLLLGLGLTIGGAVLLGCALEGKFKRILLFRVVVEGDDANLGTGVFAVVIILIGVVLVAAALLRLDCP